MKRKPATIMALLLACILVLTAASPLTAAAEAAPEKVVLDFFVESWSWSLGDGILTDAHPALKYLYDETGVELNFITYDSDKMAVYSAGGQLPALVNTTSAGVFQKMVESGQLLPLDDLLAEYGSNITSKIANGLDMQLKKYGYGKIYSIPSRVASPFATPSTRGAVAFRVRYDVWKAIGSPEYHNEDELIDVLKQMQDYQRKALERDDIWAFGVALDNGWSATPMLSSSNHLTLGTVWSLVGCVDLTTTEYVPTFIEPNTPFWNAISFINKAWRAGIMDPECFMFTSADLNDRIADGRCLSSHNWSTMPDSEFCGEEATMAALPFEPFTTITDIYGNIYPGGYPGLCITTNCKNPERVMQLLNFLASDDCLTTFGNGPKGIYWEYGEDGAPTMIGELKAAYEESKKAGSDLRSEWNLFDKGAKWWTFNNESPNAYGQVILITDTAAYKSAYLNTADRLFAEDYGCTYPGEVYAMWEKEGIVSTNTVEAQTLVALLGNPGDSIAFTRDECIAYFGSNFANIILADSDEAFETCKLNMIDEMKDRGFDAVCEAYAQLFEEAKSK